MADPMFNGVTVPASMKSRGLRYDFIPQGMSRPNGYGISRAGGPQYLIWIFNRLDSAEIDYWDTLLGGAKSVAITSMNIWDHRKTMRSFTGGVLYEPRVELYSAGAFWRVQIEVQCITPVWSDATVVP